MNLRGHLASLLAAGVSLALLWALALPWTARAQSITLDAFLPGELAADDFQLSRPVGQGHLRVGAQLYVDYANSPLVVELTERDMSSEVTEVVGHQLNATLGLSLGVAERVVVYAGLPVNLWMEGADARRLAAFGIAGEQDAAGPGNLYLGVRYVFLGGVQDPVALAVQLTGHLPTAGEQRYRGSDRLALQPELLFEAHPLARLRLTLNLGAAFRERGGPALLRERNDITYGLGAAYVVYRSDSEPTSHLDLVAQVFGRAQVADLFGKRSLADSNTVPLELLLGGKYVHRAGLTAGLAAGPGLLRGVGSPDVRVVGMIAYTMPPSAPWSDSDGDGLGDDVDACPSEAEDLDRFDDDDGCPDPDNDSDGLLDSVDGCPLEPEDSDGFEDEDGCADPDNDQDGVLDAADRCPLVAEDRDGFEDKDGCSDPDNDQDGVLDAADRCPLQAGIVDNRGCPDLDRDADTVVDRLDNCPDQAGDPKNHGCKKVQKVRLEGDRLVILDIVYFATDSARIQARSYALLSNVAEVLASHPEIKRLRIEGHTDSRGSRERNLELSRERAESVREYLVSQGQVAAERLQAQGFGPDRPIVPAARKAQDHAKNRRVEFKILEQ